MLARVAAISFGGVVRRRCGNDAVMHSDGKLVPQPGGERTPPPPRRPAAPPASSDHVPPGTSEWEKLIAAGKDRGYVTLAEVDAALEALNAYPPNDMEPAYTLLRAMGVEVIARFDGPEGRTERDEPLA